MKKIFVAALLAVSGCVPSLQEPIVPLDSKARYVAMGSSYAAGAGIGALVEGSPGRCGRTVNNYPHLVAARMDLDLTDVSCGGATTEHILGAWDELPAQMDAVTPDTKLVTITIGGNDLDYVRNLMIASCGKVPEMMPPGGRDCPSISWPTETDYQALKEHLREVAREVRRRAPEARIVFVDYLRVVPAAGGCATIPLDDADLTGVRETFRRMAEVTREAVRAEGALLLPAGELSESNDACSTHPWTNGYPGNPAAWHPNSLGHQAIANILVTYLR